MALREKLTKPLVVECAQAHTHTVIFLHRFPAETAEDELRGKVLSEKLTRNHKKLSEQFPSIRWVFPHAKPHARHWSNLSHQDKAELGLTMTLPYITQIILQEAELAGGLDNIVLGGQGESAEAAHEAMSSFPEAGEAMLACPKKLAAFIDENFHTLATEITQLRLAGFVGMHSTDGSITRDVRDYSIKCKLDDIAKVNNTIVTNTPHKFIKGGYKLQTATWDGHRIDEFADFLASIGVHRVHFEDPHGKVREMLTPRDQTQKKAFGLRDDRDDKQKHAEEITRQKAAAQRDKERILRRIEANKVERKIKQAREREARLNRELAQRQGAQGGYLSEVRTLASADAPKPTPWADLTDADGCMDGFWGEEGEEDKDDGW